MVAGWWDIAYSLWVGSVTSEYAGEGTEVQRSAVTTPDPVNDGAEPEPQRSCGLSSQNS